MAARVKSAGRFAIFVHMDTDNFMKCNRGNGFGAGYGSGYGSSKIAGDGRGWLSSQEGCGEGAGFGYYYTQDGFGNGSTTENGRRVDGQLNFLRRMKMDTMEWIDSTAEHVSGNGFCFGSVNSDGYGCGSSYGLGARNGHGDGAHSDQDSI